MNTYNTNIVEEKLNFLHQDAKKDYLKVGKGIIKSIFRPIQPTDFENVYLPISKNQGIALRELIVKRNFKNIVEFGTSFGISTIYLADAVKQTGGKVITTELLESKAKKAEQNIKEAGLSELVDFKIGDAMETLEGHNESIDLLLLDGWKDLYLPLFLMLESNFRSDTIIYVDNADMSDSKAFLSKVSENKKYHLEPKFDGKVVLISICT